MSTGENGIFEIGYHKEAKSFYLMCKSESNPYWRWCYKYDLDFVWKHRTEYISDVEEWVISSGFTIQFLSSEYDSEVTVNIDSLNPYCRLLFKETSANIYVNVEANYLKNKLQEYIATNKDSEIFYEGNCILSTGESGFCYIGYNKDAYSFYIQIITQNNPSGKWCYKFDLDFVWKHRTEYNLDTIQWEISNIFTIQFFSSNGPTSIDNISSDCRWLFKEAYDNAYYNVTINKDITTIGVGETYNLTATTYSNYANVYGEDGIAWSVSSINGTASIESSTGAITGISSGAVIVTATYTSNFGLSWSDSHIIIIYSSTDVYSLRMTRDTTNEFTLCVATLYNGEKYWYQIDDNGDYSDVLLLSDENINLINETYNNYTPFCNPFSTEYCVYQARQKLDYAIENNQLYNVTESSDEYNGLWMYFSLLEIQYREATALLLQGVNTLMTLVNVVNQAYILANNISVLANTIIYNNASQYMSGTYAIASFGNITNLQAVEQGITDVTIYSGQRPTWQQTEAYLASTRFLVVSGYKYNQSYVFVDNKLKKVSWGTPNSIRPDFYNEATGHFIDVKNYTVTTSSGRDSLINNVVNQYKNRINYLPEYHTYEVVIDVRGQNWTQDMLNEIVAKISEKTNGEIIISFIK